MGLLGNRELSALAGFAQDGLQLVFGNHTFNGTGEPDAAEGRPYVETGLDLDRTGVGLYTLTLPSTATINVLCAMFEIVDGTDLVDVVCTAINESAKTFTLKVYDRETFATLTDPTDGAKLMSMIVLAA